MKKLFSILLILLLFFVSCVKDKSVVTPDSILAGQKTGQGVYYFDFAPDISLSLIDWDQTDTSIIFDFNQDGTDDFIFERTESPHGYLGGGFERIKIISLEQNEIVVIAAPYYDTIVTPCMHSQLDWVDTLLMSDPIGMSNLWSNNASLIYYYNWDMQGCNIHDGFWQGVYTPNNKFIGFKIVKNGLNYFGWLSMYNEKANNVYKITDYAIVQEYEE